MDERVLPKIRVIDAHPEGMGTSGVESPSATTGPGHIARPRSATSSEGNTQQTNSKKSPIKIIRNSSFRDTNGGSPTSPQGRSPNAVDPLSHAILSRQSSGNLIPQKLRTTGTTTSDTVTPDIGSPTTPDIATPERRLTFNKPDVVRSDSNPTKEKKKGVSFLSRFSIIGGKKKDQTADPDSDESEAGDPRTEGMNAHVFSSSVGANGFIPQHKEPPKYIKVRAHNKKTREFNRLFLAQELSGTKHTSSQGPSDKVPGINTAEVDGPQGQKPAKSRKQDGAVWTLEFSNDGKYLAAAGRDQVVRVWAVISTPEERQAHEHEEDAFSAHNGGERLSAPVFRSKPEREFEGHTGDVLDLSWSKNNFLLSSSMDKTVKLWHVSRAECLCTFKHKDFVTSIAFHPKDDRFFLAGSLDSILRLWSIPDKSVAFWNQLPDLITAVAFSPDGKTAIAGLLGGMACFYETEGLKYHTQIHVRSSRGKNAKGSKITGIRTTTFPPDDPEGEVKVLITSNDSRVRLYNLRDKSLEMKFRGHQNTCSQINASFSDDARYVMCGSEDRKAYIWSVNSADAENKDKRAVEFFEAHSEMVTAAVILPTKSRQLLSGSGDPIYDLCNPPPVTLLSREESYTGSEKRRSVIPTSDPVIEKSPAYLARSSHNDGLIIVTADYLGIIKVFRSDCAQKRRNESLETSSSFSRKMLGRSNSIMTRNSGSSLSRRNSIAHGPPAVHSDHILNWRKNVDNGSIKSATKTTHSDRSVSPGPKYKRSSFQSQTSLASIARQQPYTRTTSISTTSPPASIHKAPIDNMNQPPTPGFSLYRENERDDLMRLDAAGKPNQFWNMGTWRNQLKNRDATNKLGGLKPPMDRGHSLVSKLSSDDTGELENESLREEGGDGVGEEGLIEEVGIGEESETEEDVLVCKRCKGGDFRARRVLGLGTGREREIKMVCKACGEEVS